MTPPMVRVSADVESALTTPWTDTPAVLGVGIRSTRVAMFPEAPAYPLTMRWSPIDRTVAKLLRLKVWTSCDSSMNLVELFTVKVCPRTTSVSAAALSAVRGAVRLKVAWFSTVMAVAVTDPLEVTVPVTSTISFAVSAATVAASAEPLIVTPCKLKAWTLTSRFATGPWMDTVAPLMRTGERELVSMTLAASVSAPLDDVGAVLDRTST